MVARIDNLVTSGTFSLDGGTWDVDNNVWLIGNDSEVIVLDPAHDAKAVAKAVAGRTVKAIILTHGHDDHIGAVGEFRELVPAPVYLNPADRMLWDTVYPDASPDHDIVDGDTFEVAGTVLTAIHTPGHSPGSMSFYVEALGTVFTGDTLFNGGPGATGRSYSDYPTIVASIRDRLLTLPDETIVNTGHGDKTSIGVEKASLAEWEAKI